MLNWRLMKSIKERTYKFALEVVKISNILPKTVAGIELGKQLLRSGSSVGANVIEAEGAYTKAEFVYHMNIAKKEAKETNYWLQIIVDSKLLPDNWVREVKNIQRECEEIIKILSKSVITAEKKLAKV